MVRGRSVARYTGLMDFGWAVTLPLRTGLYAGTRFAGLRRNLFCNNVLSVIHLSRLEE